MSPSVGKRDRADGSLTSSGFPTIRGYLGKGLGGEGSCEIGIWAGIGIGAGRAKHRETRKVAIGERIESFMVILGSFERSGTGCWGIMLMEECMGKRGQREERRTNVGNERAIHIPRQAEQSKFLQLPSLVRELI